MGCGASHDTASSDTAHKARSGEHSDERADSAVVSQSHAADAGGSVQSSDRVELRDPESSPRTLKHQMSADRVKEWDAADPRVERDLPSPSQASPPPSPPMSALTQHSGSNVSSEVSSTPAMDLIDDVANLASMHSSDNSSLPSTTVAKRQGSSSSQVERLSSSSAEESTLDASNCVLQGSLLSAKIEGDDDGDGGVMSPSQADSLKEYMGDADAQGGDDSPFFDPVGPGESVF